MLQLLHRRSCCLGAHGHFTFSYLDLVISASFKIRISVFRIFPKPPVLHAPELQLTPQHLEQVQSCRALSEWWHLPCSMYWQWSIYLSPATRSCAKIYNETPATMNTQLFARRYLSIPNHWPSIILPPPVALSSAILHAKRIFWSNVLLSHTGTGWI